MEHFIKIAMGDFHDSTQFAHLAIKSPLLLSSSSVEAVALHSQYVIQPLRLLGSVSRITSTTRIPYAVHSSYSSVRHSSSHRSLRILARVSLEKADAVVLELVEDHVTWVDLVPITFSVAGLFSKIRRLSYLLGAFDLPRACESFYPRCPER
jgi:hypothetical protein